MRPHHGVPAGRWEAVDCSSGTDCESGFICDSEQLVCVPEYFDCDDESAEHYILMNVYRDLDEDGYGAGERQMTCVADPMGPGWSQVGTDCDDS